MTSLEITWEVVQVLSMLYISWKFYQLNPVKGRVERAHDGLQDAFDAHMKMKNDYLVMKDNYIEVVHRINQLDKKFYILYHDVNELKEKVNDVPK